MKYLRIKRTLPYIRLEVIQLLYILERIAGDRYEVTARSCGNTYDNIDEMKSCPGEFARHPVIQVGPVTFNTGENSGLPELSIEQEQLEKLRCESGDALEQALVLLDSLDAELVRYNSWFKSLKFRFFHLLSIIGNLLTRPRQAHTGHGLCAVYHRIPKAS